MIVAQVSDPHVALDPETGQDSDGARGLALAVARIAEMVPAPECILLTGDLADDGSPASYARLREILAPLTMPVHPIPGNHDDRDALREAFADHPLVAATEHFVQYALDAAGLRIVMCDTLVAGAPGGSLDEERLEWIAAQLAAAPEGEPVLVALHHPPFDTGIAAMDLIGLDASARLATLLAGHPDVALVVCGHVHRTVVTSAGGRRVFLGPSTSLAIALDLRDDVPGRLVREPPAFALHVHRGGGDIVSHVQPLGDFGEPFGEV